MKPYGFVYKLTYLPTKKIYIGRHKFGDCKYYLGSGSEIMDIQRRDKRRLPNHWRKLWKRQIIDLAYSFEELREKEYDWAHKLDAFNPLIGYNILKNDICDVKYLPSEDPRVRERMSKSAILSWDCSDERRKALSNKMKRFRRENRDYYSNIMKGRKVTWRDKISDNHADVSGKNNPMYGRHHSESTKNRWRDIRRGSNLGQNNPMYGSRFTWINNGEKNKRGKIGEPIPEGWFKGKIQKSK